MDIKKILSMNFISTGYYYMKIGWGEIGLFYSILNTIIILYTLTPLHNYGLIVMVFIALAAFLVSPIIAIAIIKFNIYGKQFAININANPYNHIVIDGKERLSYEMAYKNYTFQQDLFKAILSMPITEASKQQLTEDLKAIDVQKSQLSTLLNKRDITPSLQKVMQ